MKSHRSLIASVLAPLLVPLPALAQEGGRAVVQPLPPPAAEELKTALARLARDPRNLDALIAAGTASLALNDVDAAIGFFGRAAELAPEDPRIKVGKAAAYVRTRRPDEALRLFEEAEAAGVEIVKLAGDHGLAYDLVGNNREAQLRYRRALAAAPNDEITRRMALSMAIEGNEQGFEQTLRPLLAQRDFAAYRTRAFGLAILGKPDDAVAITEAVMDRPMASKLEPYLRFMPQLTKAQQAAAANLGIYPTATRIGRDDPRIAALGGESSSARAARSVDAGLAPAGAPLGTTAVAPPPQAGPVSPAPAAQSVAARTDGPVVVARMEQPAAPGFDLRSMGGAGTTTTTAASAATTAAPGPAVREPASVADAFADLDLASAGTAVSRTSGAVDITAIEAPREVAKKEPPRKPEPAKPAHPSRHWVQVATGQDRSALKFDWRRIGRQADGLLDGKGPFVTAWGQTSRLLAGPYATAAEARNALNEIQKKGLDAFTFISPDGQEIEPLR